MADELKSTIESYVTTALRSRADEGVRLVQALRDEMTAAIARLEETLRSAGGASLSLPDDLFPPPPAPPPPASEGTVLAHILASQQELLATGDQVGLLTQLLLSCTVSCPRVAFFIAKKDALAGWAARGFESAQDSDIRGLSIPLGEDTILGAAYRSGTIVRGGRGQHKRDSLFLGRLGGEEAAECLAAPIWIRDKVAAILYGDSGREERMTDPQVPEILASFAGLCLETLPTRQKSPRPRAGAAASSGPGASASGPRSAVSVSGPQAVTPRGGVPSSTGETSGKVEAATPAEPASLSAVYSQPSYARTPATPRPAAHVAPSPAPPPSAVARPAAAAPSLEGLSDEERKMHEEARRFARLLVSEIILYNERQVEEGRRNKDIYERLKEDIDRSLAMYEQRISAKVRAQSNYFYQELVRTLANGDESAVKVPWA